GVLASSAVGTVPIAPASAFVVVAMFAIPAIAEGLRVTVSAPATHGDPAVIAAVVPPGGKLTLAADPLPAMGPRTTPPVVTLSKETSAPVVEAVRLSPQVV